MVSAEQGDQERVARSLLREAVVSPTNAERFDAFFYPIVLDFVRKRHRALGPWVAHQTGSQTSATGYDVGDDLEQLAHDAAVRALERTRRNAHQFDAAKGSALHWVCGAAAFAFAASN
jgi:hypothetical protein